MRISLKEKWPRYQAIFIPMAIGALITWGVSAHYYKKAARDLRWEARAGNILFEEQELLVAYYNWQQELKPGQAIKLEGKEGITEVWYSAEQIVLQLCRRGIVSVYSKNLDISVEIGWYTEPFDMIFRGAGIKNYLSLISDSNDIGNFTQGLNIDPNNILICLNDEGKGLARYLANNRPFSLKITELWETTGEISGLEQIECKHLIRKLATFK